MDISNPRRTRPSFSRSRLAVAAWLCGSILTVVVVAPVSGARPLNDAILPGPPTATLALALPTLPPPLPTLPLPTLPLPTPPLPSLPLPSLPLPSLPLPSPPRPTPSAPPLPSLPLPLPSASPSLPALASPSPSTQLPAGSAPATPGPSASSASAAPPVPGSPGSTPAAGGTVDESQPPGAGGSGQPGALSQFEQLLIPGLLVAVPAFLVIAIIALQVAGGVVWIPLVRRWLGRSGERRAVHRRLP